MEQKREQTKYYLKVTVTEAIKNPGNTEDKQTRVSKNNNSINRKLNTD